MLLQLTTTTTVTTTATTTTTGRRFVYPLADFAFLFILAATHLQLEWKKDEDSTEFDAKQF